MQCLPNFSKMVSYQPIILPFLMNIPNSGSPLESITNYSFCQNQITIHLPLFFSYICKQFSRQNGFVPLLFLRNKSPMQSITRREGFLPAPK
jgi:hypothetical protein